MTWPVHRCVDSFGWARGSVLGNLFEIRRILPSPLPFFNNNKQSFCAIEMSCEDIADIVCVHCIDRFLWADFLAPGNRSIRVCFGARWNSVVFIPRIARTTQTVPCHVVINQFYVSHNMQQRLWARLRYGQQMYRSCKVISGTGGSADVQPVIQVNKDGICEQRLKDSRQGVFPLRSRDVWLLIVSMTLASFTSYPPKYRSFSRGRNGI